MILKVFLLVLTGLFGTKSQNAKSSLIVWRLIGGSLTIPCPFKPEQNGDETILIILFKGTERHTVFSHDARSASSIESGLEWFDPLILENRGEFDPTSYPPGVTIIDLQKRDEDIFCCRVEYRKSPPTRTDIKLLLAESPEPPRILWDGDEVVNMVGPVQENSRIDLTCLTRGGKPKPILTWWRSGKQIKEISKESKIVGQENMIESKLSLTSERSLFAETLTCRAQTPDLGQGLMQPRSAQVRFNITLRLLSVRIVENIPHTAGTTVQLSCLAAGSQPPAQISWWKDGERLLHTTNSVMEGGRVSRSVVSLHLRPSDNLSKVVCQAYNPYVPESEIKDVITLKVWFKPSVTLNLGRSLDATNLVEGSDIFMECIISANPTSNRVEWYKDGTALMGSSDSGVILSGSSLAIQSLHRGHSGFYACLATNTEGRTKSEHLIIDVKYSPICSSPEEVIQGASLNRPNRIFCHVRANPTSNLNFSWTKILHSGREGKIEGENWINSSGTSSILTYIPKFIDDLPVFLCRARNEVGEQKTPCRISLKLAGPPSPLEDCSAELDEGNIRVECSPGFSGGLEQQFFLEAKDESNETITNLTSAFPSWLVAAALDRVSTTFELHSFNNEGRSHSSVIFYKKPTAHQQSIKESSNETASFILPLIFAIVVFFCVLLILSIFLFVRRRRQIDRNSHKGSQSSLDKCSPDVVQSVQRQNRDLDVIGFAQIDRDERRDILPDANPNDKTRPESEYDTDRLYYVSPHQNQNVPKNRPSNYHYLQLNKQHRQDKDMNRICVAEISSDEHHGSNLSVRGPMKNKYNIESCRSSLGTSGVNSLDVYNSIRVNDSSNPTVLVGRGKILRDSEKIAEKRKSGVCTSKGLDFRESAL